MKKRTLVAVVVLAMLALVLAVHNTVLPAEAHAPGVVLSGLGTATIDGVMSLGEWDNAGSLDFDANVPGGGTTPATVFVMNDASNLYLAVAVARPSMDPLSHVRFHFDNDHDGLGEDGDDFVGLAAPANFFDAFWSATFDPPSLTFYDTQDGGTTEGEGAGFNVGGSTVLEFAHPINSEDDEHDFSLSIGDVVGFVFTLTLDDGTGPVGTRVPASPDMGDIVIASPVVSVDIDIKPGSDPNCFNINGNGVMPLAILGSADFDVTQIDVSTLNFGGLDVRLKGNDSPQCSIEDVSGDLTSHEGSPDGYADLVCQFMDDSTWSADDGTATLTGNQYDGTPIEGSDSICIRPPELVVDQDNDPDETIGQHSCSTLGLSLYQSFTPAASPLAGVELRLRVGGSFPSTGVDTTINIRSDSPTGAVLGTATASVPGPQVEGTELLVFFKVSLAVMPGDTYVIEWLSPALPGEPAHETRLASMRFR